MKGINHLKVFGIIVLIFAILITIGYTMNHDRKPSLPERVMQDGMSIVQTGAVGIVDSAKDLVTNVSDLFHTFEENRRLRQRMYNYEMQSVQLSQLEAENDSLRQLLEIQEQDSLRDFTMMPATTIQRNSVQWHDFFTINRGANHGVEVDMAVLSKEGFFIGRVTQVNQLSAQVRLIKSQNVGIRASAVVDGRPNATGVLEGYDVTTGELIMTKVRRDEEIEIGDKVITSGLGGVNPRGLLIGFVERIEISADMLTQTLFLTSDTDYDNLDFVMLVQRDALNPDYDDPVEEDEVDEEVASDTDGEEEDLLERD